MYENIKSAMKLSPKEQVDNYALFDKLMKEGISIQSLIDKASKADPINDELFSVMEQNVKDVPDVKKAKSDRDKVIHLILIEMCRKDPRYQTADTAYRDAVNKAYMDGVKSDKTLG